MASRDPYLTRVNRALKELGCGVAIEVAPSGKRLRLRSTLPFPDGSWKQRRITTPITYPAGLEQARKLAEELGRDIELHRMGLDPFPFDRWFDEPKTSVGARGGAAAGDAISGVEAIRRTEQWWTVQRRRGVSASAPAGGYSGRKLTCRQIGSYARAQETLRQGHTYLPRQEPSAQMV